MRFYLVQEFLDGLPEASLRERIRASKSGLDLEEMLVLFDRYLLSLEHLHGKRIFHRDLHPGHLYAPEGAPEKAVVFGLGVALGSPGTATKEPKAGAPAYMAPEMLARNARYSQQADLYSLGASLYEALTRQVPFPSTQEKAPRAEDWSKVSFAHPVFKTDRGRQTEVVLRRVLAFDPKARHTSASEMRKELAFVPPPPPPPPPLHPPDEEEDSATVPPQGDTSRFRKIGSDVYEYIEELGKGGFGTVSHARRQRDGLEVAIKELLAPDSDTHRFVREAEILKDHPHARLVKYIDFVVVTEKGWGSTRRFFLILEYLKGMPGASLKDRIYSTPAGLDTREVLSAFIGYLDGLHYLHQEGIIHRDIKPGNLYAPKGEPQNAKIFDLGIAHDSEGTRSHGQVPGTLDYMPPEFAVREGERGSPQTDLYSLGVTFYHALTGELPKERFPATAVSGWAAFYAWAEKPKECSFDHPVFAKFPGLADVVRRCLSHDAKARYGSAQQMSDDLQDILNPPGLLLKEVEAPPAGPLPADQELVWVLAVEPVGRAKLDGLTATVVSRSLNLVAQKDVIAELKDGKVKITARSPGTSGGKVAIEVTVRAGALKSNVLTLTAEFQQPRLELKLVEGPPAQPAPADQPLVWELTVAAVGRLKLDDLSVTATSRSLSLIPQKDVTVEIEDGRVKITAQSLGNEGGKAAIEVSVSAGPIKSDILTLTAEIAQPRLELKLVGMPAQDPAPPNQPLVWELAVEAVGRSRLDDLAVTATSRSLDVLPQKDVVAEIADGRVRITAEPLKMSGGKAVVEVFVRVGTIKSNVLTLTVEIERPRLELKLEDWLPKDPIRAGRKQVWILAVESVGGVPLEDLGVTAISRSLTHLPQKDLVAKVEDGRVRITAVSQKNAGGTATVDVFVSVGDIKSNLVTLTVEILLPRLELKLVESLPKDKVRAGRKQVWVLAAEAKDGATLEGLSATAVSRSFNLLPQDKVLIHVEDGQIKITAHPPRTSAGRATVELSAHAGEAAGEIVLTMEIEPLPPPSVELGSKQPLRIASTSKAVTVDFDLKDDEGQPERLNFLFKVEPPDLVRFDPPAISGAPSRSVLLQRASRRTGSGRISVSVEAEDGRAPAAPSEYDIKVMRPVVDYIVVCVVLAVLGLAAFLYLRPSLTLKPASVNVTAGEKAEWTAAFRHARGALKVKSLNPEIIPQEKITIETNGEGSLRITAEVPEEAKSAEAKIELTMAGADLSAMATANIAAIVHSIKVLAKPPDHSLAGKPLSWSLEFSPAKDAAKASASGQSQVVQTGNGRVEVKMTAPNALGRLTINVTNGGATAFANLETEITLPSSHLELLTPQGTNMAANQDRTRLTFGVSDDDPDESPEKLKVLMSVEFPGLDKKETELPGGTKRDAEIPRPPQQFGPGTINVSVTGGSRPFSTSYPFKVEPRPCLIAGPSDIQITSTEMEKDVEMMIYDPYTPAGEMHPDFVFSPATAVICDRTNHQGTNWVLHLTRNGKEAASGKLAVSLVGRGGTVSNSFAFNVEAKKPTAVTLNESADKHSEVRKLGGPPVKVVCSLSGSGLDWKITSDNHALLDDADIQYPRNPGDDIVFSPKFGQNGVAKVHFQVTPAAGAQPADFYVTLHIDGEPTGPYLVLNPTDVIIEKGRESNVWVRVNSDYFPPEKLELETNFDPSAATLSPFPTPLTTNFQLVLTALKPGTNTINFKLKAPNGKIKNQSLQARFVQHFDISGPKSFTATGSNATIHLNITDEEDALERMTGRDFQVTGSGGPVVPDELSISWHPKQGSNDLELVISPPANGSGHVALTVTGTDIFNHSKSLPISVTFIRPWTNTATDMEFVWVPNLPGTENEKWQPPGASDPLLGGGWVAQYKVTQDQFSKVMHTNPSHHQGAGFARLKNLPVESMTFQDAIDFCQNLTKQDAAKLPQGWTYTLPSVQQWEFYAADAQPTPEYAFFGDAQRGESEPVDQKRRNKFDLCQVLGNVFELTRTPDNSQGAPGFVRRGGHFGSRLAALTTAPSGPASEFWFPNVLADASFKGPQTGFRVILVPAKAAQ